MSSDWVTPGVDRLYQYPARGRKRKFESTLQSLCTEVTVPAIDIPLYRELEDMGFTFNPTIENRSVTTSDWMWKGLMRYECARHGTTEVSGVHFASCSCATIRTGSARSRARTGSTSKGTGSTEDHVINESSRGGNRLSGDVSDSASSSGRGSSVSRCKSGYSSNDSQSVYRTDAYRAAVHSLYSTLNSVEGRIKPLSLDEALVYVDDNAYSGLPHMATNGEVLEFALNHAKRIHAGERGFDPYLYGRRVQYGNGGPKTRLIWMAPLSSTLVGTIFAKPLQKSLAKIRPYTWGTRAFERGAVIVELQTRKYVYSVDFSRFDSSVPPRILKDVFSAIRSQFDMNDEQDKLFWKYANDFIHTRIVMPDGYVWQKHKGIPSGSAFTSLVGSMVNILVMNYVWFKSVGHTLSHNQLLVMGDDSLVASDRYVSPKHMAMIAAELGFTINPEKTQVSKRRDSDIHFLGHYWRFGIPHRPYHEIARMAAMPERHSKQSLSRSLTRLSGYAFTSVEGYDVFMLAEKEYDAQRAVLKHIQRRRTGDDTLVTAKDLPGELRRRLKTEEGDFHMSDLGSVGSLLMCGFL